MVRPKSARFLSELAGNLSDLSLLEMDEGLIYLAGELGGALQADNLAIAVCLRDSADSPLSGWRPVWDVRSGPDSKAQDAVFRSWYADARNQKDDAMVVALAQTTGEPRAFRRRDIISDRDWRRSKPQELFDALGVRDRLVAAVPAGPNAEVVLTAYRRQREPAFSDANRDLAGQIAAAMPAFARRLALMRGFGDGLAPLTRRERDVLRALLMGLSEKEIARALRLTPRSLHQYVTAVYRKLNATSRAQLMARFLWANARSPVPGDDRRGFGGRDGDELPTRR